MHTDIWHVLTPTPQPGSSRCDELSIPVRLGVLVSTRFGSAFRGAEPGTFSPQHFQRATGANQGGGQWIRWKEGRQEVRAKIPESLRLIICLSNQIFHGPWGLQFTEPTFIPPQIIVSLSKPLQNHPGLLWEKEFMLSKAHLPCE